MKLSMTPPETSTVPPGERARRDMARSPSRCEGRAVPAGSNVAFTLVELLVVIAIIAILSALVFGGYRAAMGKADATQSLANMKSVGGALLAMAADNNGRLPQCYWSPDDSLPNQAYWKPNSLETSPPGTLGKDWSTHGMWVWAAHNLAGVPLKAFTTTRGNKALKAKGEVETWPAFCLNQNPQLSDSEPAGMKYWTQLTRYSAPSRTILLSEVAFDGDMWGLRPWSYANYWGTMGFRFAVDFKKKGIPRTPYVFIDGHAEMLSPEETIGPDGNRWMDPSMFPNNVFPTERAFSDYLKGFL